VLRAWTAPTPTGLRSEEILYTAWGAPREVATTDAGERAVLATVEYDARGRAMAQLDAAGAVVGTRFDAFDRPWQIDQWF
jgi:hypothetical protein